MDFRKDFKKFALDKGAQSSISIDQYIDDSLTPYILEETKLNASQIDVFSRLMRDRIIWISGAVNDTMSTIVQAQLMYLDNVEKRDITLHVDTPGGSVKSGLSIVDVMRNVKSDIVTVNTGMAASMGSVLLSAGTKGKRSSLFYSKVMLHQVSHGSQGNVQDTRITQLEAEKYNYLLFKMLSENSGRTFDEVLNLSERDNWLNSAEAVEFGIIDEVIGDKCMKSELIGFEDFYAKRIENTLRKNYKALENGSI